MQVTNQSLSCHLSPNDTSTQIINFILEAQWMLYFMTLIKHLAASQPSILLIFKKKNPYRKILTKTAHKFLFYSLAMLTVLCSPYSRPQSWTPLDPDPAVGGGASPIHLGPLTALGVGGLLGKVSEVRGNPAWGFGGGVSFTWVIRDLTFSLPPETSQVFSSSVSLGSITPSWLGFRVLRNERREGEKPRHPIVLEIETEKPLKTSLQHTRKSSGWAGRGGGSACTCVCVCAHAHVCTMHSCMWSALSYGCQKSTPGVISQGPPIMVFEAGSLTDLELSR